MGRCDTTVLTAIEARQFVCLRPKKTQWSHSELAKWAQVTSNYVETTYYAWGLKTTTHQWKKLDPMELMQKLTRWPPPSQAISWACSEVLCYGIFHWGIETWTETRKNPVLCNTQAINWACPVEIPESGYKSSQQPGSGLITLWTSALYTSPLVCLFGSICSLASTT